MIETIKIQGAKVHNLKSVNIELPKNQLICITGPSGSGKSSLAFDTIYIEGQRRYIESLSSYARQFIGQLNPPDVESISGLSPSIAINQNSTSRNPRSTVGTLTEIHDYLRVLFARVGTPHCPNCSNLVTSQSITQMVDRIFEMKDGTKIQILSPVVRKKKGEYKQELSNYQSMGFTRVRVNGEMKRLEEDDIKLEKQKKHTIDVVVDRIVLKKESRGRISDSVELASKLSNGFIILLLDKDKEIFMSEHLTCLKCDLDFPDLEPRSFSFNSPLGACEACNGIGEDKIFHPKKMVLDPNLSVKDGAITPIAKRNTFLYNMVKCVFQAEGHDISKPLNKLPKSFVDLLFNGTTKRYTFHFRSENSNFKFTKEFVGISNWLHKKYMESQSDKVIQNLEKFMLIEKCQICQGKRLNSFSLNTTINDFTISELSELSIEEFKKTFDNLDFEGEKKLISGPLLKEIKSRIKFLSDVGLNYLMLGRSVTTLSGGELQRIRLATQIGSALTGVLYVLDEPSIGLHQRDNLKLINTLKSLRDIGNTVIVVEHDEETIRESDYLVDIGPGAGVHGGKITAHGSLSKVLKSPKSLTAKFLNGEEIIDYPDYRRVPENFIHFKGCSLHNIKKLDFDLPLHCFTVVSGVSGSGKSTLIHGIAVPSLKEIITKSSPNFGSDFELKSIKGSDQVDSIIELTQSPIGRTPKSNPATYTGLFDPIRILFAATNDSKIRGYKAGRFSFNVKGGRCEVCEGNGVKKIEMHFLADVFITCEECHGKRYNAETLAILYRGKNIHDVLNMSIEEAHEFFKNHPKIERILKTLVDVGLGYMTLGQPATTLSGGEAQRVKLAKELSKKPRGHCLYILDEPTTGLHFKDIKMLLAALNQLVENGHSVIVIEHNMDVIKYADFVIDIGPEGGDKGGEIIATGTPEEICLIKKSLTGKFLKNYL